MSFQLSDYNLQRIIKVAISHSTWKMDLKLQADVHPEIWSAKLIFTQKFELPGFQIKHKINWKVDASSCGSQSKIYLKSKC